MCSCFARKFEVCLEGIVNQFENIIKASLLLVTIIVGLIVCVLIYVIKILHDHGIACGSYITVFTSRGVNTRRADTDPRENEITERSPDRLENKPLEDNLFKTLSNSRYKDKHEKCSNLQCGNRFHEDDLLIKTRRERKVEPTYDNIQPNQGKSSWWMKKACDGSCVKQEPVEKETQLSNISYANAYKITPKEDPKLEPSKLGFNAFSTYIKPSKDPSKPDNSKASQPNCTGGVEELNHSCCSCCSLCCETFT